MTKPSRHQGIKASRVVKRSARLSIATVMGALCLVLGAFKVSADSGDFLLVRRPLEVQPIRLVAVTDQSLVHLKDDQGFVTLPLSECIALLNPSTASAPAPLPRSGGLLLLADGQRLPGDAAAGVKPANDSLAWNHPWLGRLDVPLKLIAAVIVKPGLLPPETGIKDVIVFANGDRQEGIIVGLGDPVAMEVEVEGSSRVIDVPLDRIAALSLIAPKQQSVGKRIWFEEGTVLDVQSVAVGDDQFVKLTGSAVANGTQPTGVRLSQIAAVLLDSKALLPLADLAPSRLEGPITRYTLTKPELLDAEAPLNLSRIELRGPIVVRYALPAGCARFTAEAVLPAAARNWGDCELIVRLDDAVAFTARLNAETPEATISIPVTGRELTIEVAAGARGPIQDHVILTRAMLLRK